MKPLKTLLAIILSAACMGVHAATPNIVIILADDLGYGDVGCYNPDSKIPTPHLDTMAKAGMRFTDAHSPSAVCSPTRYALLTGTYAPEGQRALALGRAAHRRGDADTAWHAGGGGL